MLPGPSSLPTPNCTPNCTPARLVGPPPVLLLCSLLNAGWAVPSCRTRIDEGQQFLNATLTLLLRRAAASQRKRIRG